MIFLFCAIACALNHETEWAILLFVLGVLTLAAAAVGNFITDLREALDD